MGLGAQRLGAGGVSVLLVLGDGVHAGLSVAGQGGEVGGAVHGCGRAGCSGDRGDRVDAGATVGGAGHLGDGGAGGVHLLLGLVELGLGGVNLAVGLIQSLMLLGNAPLGGLHEVAGDRRSAGNLLEALNQAVDVLRRGALEQTVDVSLGGVELAELLLVLLGIRLVGPVVSGRRGGVGLRDWRGRQDRCGGEYSSANTSPEGEFLLRQDFFQTFASRSHSVGADVRAVDGGVTAVSRAIRGAIQAMAAWNEIRCGGPLPGGTTNL